MPQRPGITFETATPSLPETLPRMDVAAFVGFATRGPIDVPVPVEDRARFWDIFGPPLELARDVEAERATTSHLHRAVEAFFRNGGRRCWVVRVAQDADEASAAGPVARTTLGLPGLVSAETGRPTTVRARCYGATFNALRAGTVLHRQVLPDPSSVLPTPPEASSAGAQPTPLAQAQARGLDLSWAPDRPDPLSETDLVRGDLLRVSMEEGLVAYAAVDSLTRESSPSAQNSQTVRIAPVRLFADVPDSLAGSENETVPVDVTIPARTPSGTDISSRSTSARTFAVRRAPAEGLPQFQLVISEPREDVGSSGVGGGEVEDATADLVGRVVHFEEGDGGLTGWAQLGDVIRRSTQEGAETLLIEIRDVLWPVSASEVTTTGLPTVEGVQRLRFDLLAWTDQGLDTRLDELGFAEEHPRAWTDLPVDEDLFALQEGEAVPPASGTLCADAFDPRFPFASPDAPGVAPFVPLGMCTRPDPDRTLGRLFTTADHSRLEQERLRTFSTDVFVDADLRGTHSARLKDKADRRFYLEENGTDATGLHSLWPIDEPTLLVVPDAVHRGWDEPRSIVPTPVSTPFLPAPTVDRDAAPPVIHLSWTGNRLEQNVTVAADGNAFEPVLNVPVDPIPGSDNTISIVTTHPDVAPADRVRLSWTVARLGDEVEVEVQEATTPTFEDPVVRYRGADSSVNRYVRSDEPVTLFFRHRVWTGGRAGAWSNTRRVVLPAADFDPCGDRPAMPEVAVYREGGSRRRTWVRWPKPKESPDPEVEYDIQIDRTPTFDAPEDPVGENEEFPVSSSPPDSASSLNGPDYYWWEGAGWDAPAIQYVRVRARRSTRGETLVSPWSNTVAVVRRMEEDTPVVSTEEYETPTPETSGGGRPGLLDVHTAMLRFGAARGDLLSVLALPKHDQPGDARRHVTRLQTPGAQLDYDEERTLSYGTVYYPWLLHPSEDRTQLVPTPPDGAACGLLAKQALREGAWTAAANTPLAAVQTVVPPLGPGERAPLEAQQVNAFGEMPAGVLTLGAATLSRDPDLESIPTRRLLILVRRLVRREGPELVFENHTARLRQRIAEQFDEVLRRLFRRGAFAGTTPDEGYRVVADESVNPPGQVERGRLAVEIRIAPAEPLKFITVRLVQRGGTTTVTEAPVPASA